MAETLPSDIANLIGSSHIQGRALLLAIATDIDETGHLANQWLLVTERAIAVTVPNDQLRQLDARCVRTFLHSEIEGCRTQVEVGSGYLQVKKGQVWVDVLRFSNRLAPQFQEVVQKLEQLRRFGEFPLEESEATDDGNDTGQAHGDSAAGAVKPATPTYQILNRVFALLRPYLSKALLIGGLSITTVAIELVPPWLQMVLVDRVLGSKEPASQTATILATLTAIVAGLALVATGVFVAQATAASNVYMRILESPHAAKAKRSALADVLVCKGVVPMSCDCG